MELQINGGATVEVADAVFGAEFKQPLIHQVVTAYLAAGRAGTKAQKSRSAVSGGGAKPFRQKGTGRARAGTIRSPIWRSGGKTFAAEPRDYAQKVNRKMYRGALRSIFSELVRQERLVVVDDFSVADGKAKAFVAKLAELGLDRALVIDSELEEKLYRAARNVPRVAVRDVAGIDPVSLIGFDKVVVTVPAVKAIEEWLA